VAYYTDPHEKQGAEPRVYLKAAFHRLWIETYTFLGGLSILAFRKNFLFFPKIFGFLPSLTTPPTKVWSGIDLMVKD
jgi:hypothetical protein